MVRLDDVADVRAGDKGDTLILAVLVRPASDYDWLTTRMSADKVAAHFGHRASGVRRHLVPGVRAMVFTLTGVLGGGVTGSTTLDGHGKTLSYHLLDLALPDFPD